MQSAIIADALRNGDLGDLGSFSTVVGIGHSYGSNLMVGVASVSPAVFDALILTGFTYNATRGPLGTASFESIIATVTYPCRFSGLSNAYVTTPSISADQQVFFHHPDYTQAALSLFTATKSEYSLGQLDTFVEPRKSFNKPVLVMTGENDGPYCAANCYVTSLGHGSTQLDIVRALSPSVDTFQTYVVPTTGHGINYHITAYEAYQQIINFVSGQSS